MTKLHITEVDYNDSFEKQLYNLDGSKDYYINNFPVLYVIYTLSKAKYAYIGETNSIVRRTQQHLLDDQDNKHEPKFNNLHHMLVIGEETFNKSATVNLETRLINLFLADNFKLSNTKQTKLLSTNDYYQKEYYDDVVLKDLWAILRKRHLVNESIDFLENSDVYKISPFKSLSSSQLTLKEEVIKVSQNWLKSYNQDQKPAIYIVKGDAGVGKSVVLSSIYNEIQNISHNKNVKENALYQTNNYLLVNHNEMLKQYHHLAKRLKNLSKNHILKPTTFINEIDKGKHDIADVTLVDEAHLLLTSKDKYNNFIYQNQLEEVIKRSKVTVLFFDPHQFLKLKSYWNESDLQPFKQKYKHKEFCLTEQFRINAGPSVLHWINDFVNCKIDEFPKIHEQGKSYDFRIFNNGNDMFEAIKKRNRECKLSRVVSTFDYEYHIPKKSKIGEKEATYKVQAGTLELPWNTTNNDNSWAERDETINEAGSIYTIQGADLNYVGVILGPSISFDEHKNELKILPNKYKDTDAFRGRHDLSNRELAKKQIILNSINVLMKRGIHGLYIFAEDKKLRSKLVSLNHQN
ncbi:DNA/RNA helicase domain-containing protein [Pediococcus cellicola]|uniref:GIY-YIG domain-containing protein n=1 Tax=Pediococcus cellicola TaxID=319652 RepID=A0A0R2IJ49_9LACO|nr:DNA/RNA helicase domain-containing protein [Pediococcus cellicola]KRN65027.1 hypothetical protein IV80_GL000537 [Pediococcus cellicola]GEL15887.1 hypothetical protein PCE01_16890 [Pediococcus cellicola]